MMDRPFLIVGRYKYDCQVSFESVFFTGNAHHHLLGHHVTFQKRQMRFMLRMSRFRADHEVIQYGGWLLMDNLMR